MLRLPNDWVWDSWIADDGEQYHLFFLKAPRSLKDPALRHTAATIGHATSPGLVRWTLQADALLPAPRGGWDDLALWTGSVLRGDDGVWRLYYTALSSARRHGVRDQRIGLAESDDLFEWRRAGDQPLVCPDQRWYKTLDDDASASDSWRDPFVFKDPRGDGWHMLITARARGAPRLRDGVLAHARSPSRCEPTQVVAEPTQVVTHARSTVRAVPIQRSTGMPHLDAQADFARARRRQHLARIAAWLSREHDVGVILPFEEVVRELGFVGERELGRQVITLDTIVGSVDRTRDFDRSFRPTSPRTRGRWEGIATATRRGQAMPPIDVYRIGEIHFVRDGHHRVSVARALGWKDIEANVTEVQTRVGAEAAIELADLPLKGHERLFWERVPIPAEARQEIKLSDPWSYGDLAEGIEAWGFRAMQQRGQLLDRETVARMWLEEEYRPVVALLREAGMIEGSGTETEMYMRVAAERYRLLRTHAWSDDVLERLRASR